MFGIDGPEFLVIMLIAAIVIGPKDMPKMLRAFAAGLARLRAVAQEFRGPFNEAMRRADMKSAADSLNDLRDSVKNLDPRRKLQEFYDSLAVEMPEEQKLRQEAEEFDRRRAETAENAGAAENAPQPRSAAKAEDARAPQPDSAANLDCAARAAIEGGALPVQTNPVQTSPAEARHE